MVQSVKPVQSTWCPGCGDFGVLAAVKKAALEMKVPQHELILVGGIGCSGGIHNFIEVNGIHALHGRLLAQAVGVKLSNPSLTVVAAGGDGDGYAIGMGHFMHAFKKNASILYIVMNNETYGLTKGQASPTSQVGFEGNIERPFDAILTALSVPSPNFIARTFSGDSKTMIQVLIEALKFNKAGKGYAFVEDLSPCITYNDTFKEWREKVLDVSKLPDYDPSRSEEDVPVVPRDDGERPHPRGRHASARRGRSGRTGPRAQAPAGPASDPPAPRSTSGPTWERTRSSSRPSPERSMP